MILVLVDGDEMMVKTIGSLPALTRIIYGDTKEYARKLRQKDDAGIGVYLSGRRMSHDDITGVIASIEDSGKSHVGFTVYADWVHAIHEERKKARIAKSNVNEMTDAVLRWVDETMDTFHVQTEFSHWSLGSRPDIFGVSDRGIFTIEIKSDRDTFVRLEKQLKDYYIMSNFMYLAVDVVHAEKAIKFLCDKSIYAGLLVYDEGVVTEDIPSQRKEMVVVDNLLWKPERLAILSPFTIKRLSSMKEGMLVDIAHTVYTVKEYREITRAVFIHRYHSDNDITTEISRLYRNHDAKQALIDSDFNSKRTSPK